MQYKPNSYEILEAISEFLRKDILNYIKSDEKLSYKTLVSWNMINILMREIEQEEQILINEIRKLSELLNLTIEIPVSLKQKRERLIELLKILVKEIKEKKISSPKHPYWKFSKELLKSNLSISNPRYFEK